MTRRRITFVVHKDGDPESRTAGFPTWTVRLGLFAASAFFLVVAMGIVLYAPIARIASRVPGLERQVQELQAENAKVLALARSLEAAEVSYLQLRTMLGADVVPPPDRSDATPTVAYPVFARPPVSMTQARTTVSLTMRWPLDEPGIITRGAVQGDDGAEQHTGLDVAVPIGTPIRAAAPGVVSQAADHLEYGLFVRITHSGGFESMYGHASRLLVAAGDTVESGQVIALSGSTGRSTAPHLHYEVFREGRSLDPRTLSRESN